MIVLEANILIRAFSASASGSFLKPIAKMGSGFIRRRFRMPTQRSICPLY